jgi:hypothetical protein
MASEDGVLMMENNMRTVLPAVDVMLNHEQMSMLEGRRVDDVSRDVRTSEDSLSGSKFESVVTEGEGGQMRYVMKRIALEWDWLMRAMNDTGGRAVTAWEVGVLDRLPETIEHCYVACSIDGDGFAILMHDVADLLVPPGDDPISPEDNARFLKHMAQMHAAFWGQTEWADPRFGFCDLLTRYACFTPRTAEREAGSPDVIPPIIGVGWQLLEQAVEPDVAGIIRPLLDDPTPLARSLARFPQTLVHHDWKLGNMGVTHDTPEPRTILLDWAQVGVAPPACDLAWYLAVNSARLPVTKEESIAIYRKHLAESIGAAFTLDWWEPQLALALLGGFVLLGWPKTMGAVQGDPPTRKREQAEIEWWSEWVRRGAKLL